MFKVKLFFGTEELEVHVEVLCEKNHSENQYIGEYFIFISS